MYLYYISTFYGPQAHPFCRGFWRGYGKSVMVMAFDGRLALCEETLMHDPTMWAFSADTDGCFQPTGISHRGTE